VNKVVSNTKEAIQGIEDNMTWKLYSFLENYITALVKARVKGLTCISNSAKVNGFDFFLQKKYIFY